jgi:hypothetical protein
MSPKALFLGPTMMCMLNSVYKLQKGVFKPGCALCWDFFVMVKFVSLGTLFQVFWMSSLSSAVPITRLDCATIRCNRFGDTLRFNQGQHLHGGYLGGKCSLKSTLTPHVIVRYHDGKTFQYKAARDQLVTIKNYKCVHGGLCTPCVSNLISVTTASGTYSFMVPQNMWFALFTYAESGTRLTAAVITVNLAK